MSSPLDQIEQRLETLIEVHLIRYLTGPLTQKRVAERLTESLRANIGTQSLEPLPHHFILRLHPSTQSTWEKDPRLLDGLTKIFRLATSEAQINFDAAPVFLLEADSTVAIDDVKVKVRRTLSAVEETQNSAEPAAATSDETPTGKTAFLIVGGTKVHTLQNAITNIGRRLDNHLVIDDPRVSRYHAQIRYMRGRFLIFDLNSTGGTYVNGQRISQSVLYPGDVISLAGLPVIFGQDNPPQSINSGDTMPLSSAASERSTAVLKNQPKTDNIQE